MSDLSYKVLGSERQSHHGGTGKWRKGKWRSVTGSLVPCENGIHYCRADQLIHWLGPTIWVFEDGTPTETINAGDKMVTRRGRIVEPVATWNEATARLFAAHCAEAVLPIFYKARPDDDRPQKAIDAARAFARDELPAAASAAARDAARDAAWDAASDAAWAAARAAARDAAWDAARAAASAAAWAAASAAASAAAWDAAWAAQTALLFDYLEGRKVA